MTTTGTGSFHLIINSTEFDNLFASPLVSITMKGTWSSWLRKNKKELFEELYKADNSNLRSLHHVSVACLPKPMRVLTTKAPRVFHIGAWSVLRQFLQLASLRLNIVMIPLSQRAAQPRESRLSRGRSENLGNSGKSTAGTFSKKVIFIPPLLSTLCYAIPSWVCAVSGSRFWGQGVEKFSSWSRGTVAGETSEIIDFASISLCTDRIGEKNLFGKEEKKKIGERW